MIEIGTCARERQDEVHVPERNMSACASSAAYPLCVRLCCAWAFEGQAAAGVLRRRCGHRASRCAMSFRYVFIWREGKGCTSRVRILAWCLRSPLQNVRVCPRLPRNAWRVGGREGQGAVVAVIAGYVSTAPMPDLAALVLRALHVTVHSSNCFSDGWPCPH